MVDTPSRTFTSYATPYDSYEGRFDWDELRPEQQNKIILSHLHQENDFNALVMENQWKKSQAEGLNSLIVGVSIVLERRLSLLDSAYRDKSHATAILAFLEGTTIGKRLRQAHEGVISKNAIITIDPEAFEEMEERYDELCDATIEEAEELIEATFGLNLNDLTYEQFTRLYNRDELIFRFKHKQIFWMWLSDRSRAKRERCYFFAAILCALSVIPLFIYWHLGLASFMIIASLYLGDLLNRSIENKFVDTVVKDEDFFDECKAKKIIMLMPPNPLSISCA